MPSKNYKVGFGKPPKETQFKPGDTGNPKGRPRKSKNPNEQKINLIVTDELAETIVITENGKKKRVTKKQALFKILVAKAMKGDSKSAAQVLKLIPSAEEDSTREWDAITRRQVTEAVDIAHGIISNWTPKESLNSDAQIDGSDDVSDVADRQQISEEQSSLLDMEKLSSAHNGSSAATDENLSIHGSSAADNREPNDLSRDRIKKDPPKIQR